MSRTSGLTMQPTATTSATRYPHVAIFVDKSRAYGRGLLQGIADYVETYGPWSIFVDWYADGRLAPDWLRRWEGSGVLAFVRRRAVARSLLRMRTPVVEAYCTTTDLGLPHVGCDEYGIGRIAAEHLLERGFTRFAFSGVARESWSRRRGQGFRETVQSAGYTCQTFTYPLQPIHRRPPEVWEQAQVRLVRWLAKLPRPIGLMACGDPHGQQILDACRRAEIAVPEELAVIGVDNDEELCRLTNPPLSSVVNNSRQIGFEAASLLDRLMIGQIDTSQAEPVYIPPVGVATRRSTDITAIENPHIAEAARLIQQHACEGLTIDGLLGVLPVSRSTFYRAFEQAVGRSPHAEILRVRLGRVRQLLTQTDLPLREIAVRTGFEDRSYLHVVFRREGGMTPGQFRERHRRGA